MLDIKAIPILTDNYVWLIADQANRSAVVVDPGDAAPVAQALQQQNVSLAGILVTHQHWDHVGGIEALVKQYHCPVFGPNSPSIPSITHPVHEGSEVAIDNTLRFSVIEIPGHTQEHLGYILEQPEGTSLFCGDTLFSAGCGRLLGGTATQLKSSLDRIKQLPIRTSIYCTHEYTAANLLFANTVMPENAAVKAYMAKVKSHRQNNAPTLPSTLETELQINPFLRCDDDQVKATVEAAFDKQASNEEDVFTLLRQWKDRF
ncbi:hydroxyacylglutathione hydrolase [Teredinibacter haidensis]|uniref:hydroxyacylglutathione hydrolase n=1 Tax=Teredinibacter haidensis TaxID=2731755 RepID=UPI00094917FB|nr:hydroxyacylglutathione hydrolase [Teredinibacter haidensis]